VDKIAEKLTTLIRTHSTVCILYTLYSLLHPQ